MYLNMMWLADTQMVLLCCTKRRAEFEIVEEVPVVVNDLHGSSILTTVGFLEHFLSAHGDSSWTLPFCAIPSGFNYARAIHVSILASMEFNTANQRGLWGGICGIEVA
jgi:hypothetical protein